MKFLKLNFVFTFSLKFCLIWYHVLQIFSKFRNFQTSTLHTVGKILFNLIPLIDFCNFFPNFCTLCGPSIHQFSKLNTVFWFWLKLIPRMDFCDIYKFQPSLFCPVHICSQFFGGSNSKTTGACGVKVWTCIQMFTKLNRQTGRQMPNDLVKLKAHFAHSIILLCMA